MTLLKYYYVVTKCHTLLIITPNPSSYKLMVQCFYAKICARVCIRFRFFKELEPFSSDLCPSRNPATPPTPPLAKQSSHLNYFTLFTIGKAQHLIKRQKHNNPVERKKLQLKKCFLIQNHVSQQVAMQSETSVHCNEYSRLRIFLRQVFYGRI